MRNKYLPNYLNLGLTFSGALLMMLQAVLPATAQTGNQSDATGPIYSGSNIAGNLTQQLGGSRTVFVSVKTQINVNLAAANVIALLSSTTLTTVTGNSIPVLVQQNLLIILRSGTNVAASTKAFSNALSRAPGAPSGKSIQKLLGNLRGLFKSKVRIKDLKDSNDSEVDFAQLQAAISAYNDLILDSQEEFLKQPPAELLAIQAVLSQLIAAAGAS